MVNYFKQNIQPHAIVERTYVVLAIVYLAFIVSFFAVLLLKCGPRCNSVTGWKLCAYTKVHTLDEDDAYDPDSTDYESDDTVSGAQHDRVCIYHRYSRPNISDVLDDIIAKSDDQGVFASGPVTLVQSVKEAVSRHGCSLYQEVFEY